MWELCRGPTCSWGCWVSLQVFEDSGFPGRSMGSACAGTTRPGTTVRNVLRSTTTSPGSQEMGKQGHPMNAEVSGREFTDPCSQTSRQSSPTKTSVIYSNGAITETGDKLLVIDGELQCAGRFSSLGLLGSGIYNPEIWIPGSYTPDIAGFRILAEWFGKGYHDDYVRTG